LLSLLSPPLLSLPLVTLLLLLRTKPPLQTTHRGPEGYILPERV
jgi:hypothetical protein